jgi:hypothetical protein
MRGIVAQLQFTSLGSALLALVTCCGSDDDAPGASSPGGRTGDASAGTAGGGTGGVSGSGGAACGMTGGDSGAAGAGGSAATGGVGAAAGSAGSFGASAAAYYWSSTPAFTATTEGYAAALQTDLGIGSQRRMTDLAAARCVRQAR